MYKIASEKVSSETKKDALLKCKCASIFLIKNQVLLNLNTYYPSLQCYYVFSWLPKSISKNIFEEGFWTGSDVEVNLVWILVLRSKSLNVFCMHRIGNVKRKYITSKFNQVFIKWN